MALEEISLVILKKLSIFSEYSTITAGEGLDDGLNK